VNTLDMILGQGFYFVHFHETFNLVRESDTFVK
jgi:hypothetical protein